MSQNVTRSGGQYFEISPNTYNVPANFYQALQSAARKLDPMARPSVPSLLNQTPVRPHVVVHIPPGAQLSGPQASHFRTTLEETLRKLYPHLFTPGATVNVAFV
jgi:hypothetical protein